MPTDSTIVRYSGDWAFYNGAVAAGALLTVYNSGTSDLASIFTNSTLTTASANPITADSGGLLPFAWIGSTAYKVRLTTSGGTLIDEQDVIDGAIDTDLFTAGDFAAPDQNMNAKTANYTVVAGDMGTILNCDCSGGAFDITMISAVTATNGRGVTIRHVGTANTVGIVTVSSQTITSPTTGVTTTSFELVGYGESVTLESDGANWHVTRYVPPLLRPNTPGVITITDRVSAAPSSNPGKRYIVSAAFSTFETHDIIEDNGQGGFIEITPPSDCGWIAYVQDEDRFYSFKGSAWVDILNTLRVADMPTGTIVGRAYAETTTEFTVSATIPADDTIPQNTEGTEVLTASITPRAAANRIRVRFTAWGRMAIADSGVPAVALFIDSTANALDARSIGVDTGAGTVLDDRPFNWPIILEFEHSPGTTVSTTYKIRIGGPITINEADYYGGVSRATLVLEEIQI